MGMRGAQTRKGYVMDVTFYKCNHCGNVAVKPFDKKVPLSCCGEKMSELVANSTDAAVEKHVPVVSVSGNAVHVEVGSVVHPMTDEHLIAFVCLVTQEGLSDRRADERRQTGSRLYLLSPRAIARSGLRVLQPARSVGR